MALEIWQWETVSTLIATPVEGMVTSNGIVLLVPNFWTWEQFPQLDDTTPHAESGQSTGLVTAGLTAGPNVLSQVVCTMLGLVL